MFGAFNIRTSDAAGPRWASSSWVSAKCKVSDNCEVFLASWLLPKLDPKSLLWQNLYMLYWTTTLTQFYEEQSNIAFKALRESLMNPPVLGHPNCQISLLHLERKETPLGYSPKNMGPPSTHRVLISSKQTLWHGDIHFASEPLLPMPFWVRTLRRLFGGPFNHLCTPCSKSPPEFSHSPFFSVSHLTSYEIL